MGLFGSLFGAGLDYAGQYMNYAYTKALQENQYDLNIRGLKESPSAQRKGLEDAGYNPLLAVSNLSNASVSPASAPNAPNIGSNAVNSYQESQRIKNETKTAVANINNLDAQSNSANAQAENQRQQAITEQSKRNRIEVQNNLDNVETELKKKDLTNYERRFYNEMKALMMNAQANSASAAAAQINAEASFKNANTNAMLAPSLEYKNYGQGSSSWSSLARNFIAKRSSNFTNAKQAKHLYKMLTSPIGSNDYKSAKAQFFTTLH